MLPKLRGKEINAMPQTAGTWKTVIVAVAALVWPLTFVDPAPAAEPAEGVVLINPFVVPPDALDETIAMWEQARAFLAAQPGYISTKLHQAVSPDAHYLLINVANWESIETFQAAIAAMQQQAELPKIAGVIPAPQLYTVIRE